MDAPPIFLALYSLTAGTLATAAAYLAQATAHRLGTPAVVQTAGTIVTALAISVLAGWHCDTIYDRLRRDWDAITGRDLDG